MIFTKIFCSLYTFIQVNGRNDEFSVLRHGNLHKSVAQSRKLCYNMPYEKKRYPNKNMEEHYENLIPG